MADFCNLVACYWKKKKLEIEPTEWFEQSKFVISRQILKQVPGK